MANDISEWFGHRVYPTAQADPSALADQRAQRCPFLTGVVSAPGGQKCVKPQKSLGVCTINSDSNGHPQEWIVCPYRVVGSALFEDAARRMYGVSPSDAILLLPAPRLSDPDLQIKIQEATLRHELVIVYFTDKLGGEIALPGTARSPRFNLDTTFVELVQHRGGVAPSRFAILETQTMDFHGSYDHARQNLEHALRLHRDGFADVVAKNQQWTGEKVEGPNIANVFKRTFYQIMFKFQIGEHHECAGCALALPVSVWDSWQPHLGAPALTHNADGTRSLPATIKPGRKGKQKQPAWIYVFDIDAASATTPNPVKIVSVIRVDADSVAHFALRGC